MVAYGNTNLVALLFSECTYYKYLDDNACIPRSFLCEFHHSSGLLF